MKSISIIGWYINLVDREVTSGMIVRIGTKIKIKNKDLRQKLSYVKSEDEETQEYILNLKRDFAEKASYHFTALAFEKESYNTIKRELEKVRDKLVKELKEE